MFLVTGLGERLKEARNAKGYTLDDLQEITKIQKRYLSAIEHEDYKTMPGSFYVRAFIKQYAEAVDLDANEMLSLYRNDADAVKEEEEERPVVTPPPNLSRSSARRSHQFNEVMPKVIVALFIIVILLVVAFLWKHNSSKPTDIPGGTDNPVQVEDQSKDTSKKDTEKKDDSKKDEKDDEKASDDKEKEEKADEQKIEFASSSGENMYYTLTGADTFNVEVRTSGPSWIGITDENGQELTPEARTMDEGEKVEVDATDKKQIRVRVGRTGETEIFINGEKLTFESDLITQNIYIELEK